MEWIIGAALGALASVYVLFILPTQWLKIERVQRPLGLGIKVLQLSDLHVERLRITPRQLARVIASERPDYLFLTGDYTELEHQLLPLDRYLEAVQQSGVPAYAVLGNHDHHLRKLTNLIKLLQSRGIVVLRNEAVQLPGFQLIGIDDFGSGKARVLKAFHSVHAERPRVVITHDPNIVLHLTERYDYLMAGHLHGKQINVPFLYRIRPMGKLPASGIYKGLHHSPQGHYYISKGLGQTGVNARLFVRSEVTVHEL
ncbi:metallophosphoesterase [Paenibacillus sp. YYML68]|uniref:metallophosphoesterase n=1 Tax=Paenibacillus sp. YYML68 TaxID=2909250 RepID=UPI002491D17B|nr:metallophosphoesterase [Paenibacillus sp. YYML68]